MRTPVQCSSVTVDWKGRIILCKAMNMVETKSAGESSKSTGGTDSLKAVTDIERDLAQSAQSEYSKGSYQSATSILAKLHSLRPKDPKVLMNKAVSEYYKSELRRTDSFHRALVEICSQTGIKLERGSGTEEADQSVIHLNHAVVLFHLHQYQASASLLETMYGVLESLEESIAISLCILLAECYLALGFPAKTLSVVGHTEATFLPQPLTPQVATAKQLQACDRESKSPEKKIGKVGEKACTASNISGADSAGSSSSIINNSGIGGSGTGLRCSAGQEQLRGKLQMLRVRALLHMKMIRLSKKELKAVVTHALSSGNQVNVTLIMLKSQLEYLKSNAKKAMKVMNQCGAIPPPSSTYGPKLKVAYNNNQGILHYDIKKPALSCFYFQKALLEELDVSDGSVELNKQLDPSSLPLYIRSGKADLEVCHNLGIMLLHVNKPTEAFEFLLKVLQCYPNNPRLWLRMAECCIGVHKLNITENVSLSNVKHLPLCEQIGAGRPTKLSFNMSFSDHNKKLKDQKTVVDAAIPVPTLEFARLCLRNALVLLPENVSTVILSEEQEASGTMPELYSWSPSPPLRGIQVMNLRFSCLAASAYVSLCLGEDNAALRYAHMLLNIVPKSPSIYNLLGHLYAGESLVNLGKCSEALSHFDPRLVGDITSFKDPDSSSTITGQNGNAFNSSGWYPNTSQEAVYIMKYNLAATHAMRGSLDKASELLSEIGRGKSEDFPAHAVMLATYIHLRKGNMEGMKNVLQKHLLT